MDKVQRIADKSFPAQELWHNPKTRMFWAFKKNEGAIDMTYGFYDHKGVREYASTIYQTSNVETEVEKMIKVKETEGFVCYGIMLD